MERKNFIINTSAVGFFTFIMFWTLDGSSGKDMNDIMVEYWEARIEVPAVEK